MGKHKHHSNFAQEKAGPKLTRLERQKGLVDPAGTEPSGRGCGHPQAIDAVPGAVAENGTEQGVVAATLGVEPLLFTAGRRPRQGGVVSVRNVELSQRLRQNA